MRDWFWITISVPNLSDGIEIYVRKWKLFNIVDYSYSGKGVILQDINPEDVPYFFRLELCLENSRDKDGNLLGGRNVKFSFPKANLHEWAEDVFGGQDIIQNTPWAAYVHLNDPFGHRCIVHTMHHKIH